MLRFYFITLGFSIKKYWWERCLIQYQKCDEEVSSWVLVSFYKCGIVLKGSLKIYRNLVIIPVFSPYFTLAVGGWKVKICQLSKNCLWWWHLTSIFQKVKISFLQNFLKFGIPFCGNFCSSNFQRKLKTQRGISQCIIKFFWLKFVKDYDKHSYVVL